MFKVGLRCLNTAAAVAARWRWSRCWLRLTHTHLRGNGAEQQGLLVAVAPPRQQARPPVAALSKTKTNCLLISVQKPLDMKAGELTMIPWWHRLSRLLWFWFCFCCCVGNGTSPII